MQRSVRLMILIAGWQTGVSRRQDEDHQEDHETSSKRGKWASACGWRGSTDRQAETLAGPGRAAVAGQVLAGMAGLREREDRFRWDALTAGRAVAGGLVRECSGAGRGRTRR